MIKENVPMTNKRRRIFTDEQKAEALRIVEQADKPVSQVASELGISVSAIHRWNRQAQIDRKSDSSGELTSNERKELVALRRDLKRVEMERDFLKKVSTFFARESGNPMS
jgi:transposase